MKTVKSLIVKYHDRKVGTLAETKDGKVAFQYDKEWLVNGFSISPFSLPLEDRVFVPTKDIFGGVFGVFADSLPDGWGRLLVDRMLLKQNIPLGNVTELYRLGIVGSTGMGALEYEPEINWCSDEEEMDLDKLSLECKKILQEKDSEDLDLLVKLGGSSGGARPKVLANVNQEHWLIKFPSSMDSVTIGEEEYRYMKCAKRCGIEVPEVKLFPSKLHQGYFGVKRFDRGEDKIHMISVAGLLETSHRYPNLDYHDLMKLTYSLTRDNRQLEEMFRRMCFNVFAHNRDDHSKNFSYLYIEKEKRWQLSPAYDLTYSNSIGGEHATCINGNGSNPRMKDILQVAEKAGLSQGKAREMAENIREIVREDLREYS